MAPVISQAQRTWLYITWPLTFVVHILQIRCMPGQPKSLQFSIFLFAILTLAFFGGFTACDNPDNSQPSSNAAFGLFTTSEITCMVHVVFLQYVSTIYPLAATIPSSRARLGFRVTGPLTVVKGTPLQSGRRNVIILGIAAQVTLVAVGAALLVSMDTEVVFGTPNISYLLEIGLFVYSLINERRTRTSSLWWWTGLTALTAAASITLLVVGLHYPSVPLFGLQCIFGLFDSLGGVYRQYRISQNKDAPPKTPSTRRLKHRRQDTPSFGDFCTSGSELSSNPTTPTKSDVTSPRPVQFPSLPPPLPPPPPPSARPPILLDSFFMEKPTPRTTIPVPSIPMNPRLFSDVSDI